MIILFSNQRLRFAGVVPFDGTCQLTECLKNKTKLRALGLSVWVCLSWNSQIIFIC
eukprot:m.340365 g.340365  ORF g.340365 m.340365 type:complete len:56 (-) comp16102_c0_seq1:4422-4589(-)